MKNKKNKKKIRFFNRPVKIGLGFAGFGGSLEFGSQSIYELIQDQKLIFYLEIAKYLCFALSFIFGAKGVAKQASEDFKSIKIGEEVKKIVKKVSDLEDKPIDTFEKEEEVKKDGFKKVFNIAMDILKNRNK